jgi:predicted Zn-dependent protease
MMPPVLPTRIALVAVALLACAGFALGIRQVRDQWEAQRLIGTVAPTAAKAARARHLLERASELNPDAQPDLVRAILDLRVHDRPAAQRVLVAITRREPENINAWYLLQIATLGRAPALNVRARERVRELAGQTHR